jgi:hypothetical protein
MKRERKQKASGGKGPITFDTVRALARDLPGAVEGTSYGTPAFKVGKCLFTRQHQDGESLVVKIDYAERSMRMKTDPATFYITDHYLNYPWVLVRLAEVELDDLRELLADAWRLCAPARLRSAHDGGQPGKAAKSQSKRKPRGGQSAE